jgi:hypothetical protein
MKIFYPAFPLLNPYPDLARNRALGIIGFFFHIRGIQLSENLFFFNPKS